MRKSIMKQTARMVLIAVLSAGSVVFARTIQLEFATLQREVYAA